MEISCFHLMLVIIHQHLKTSIHLLLFHLKLLDFPHQHDLLQGHRWRQAPLTIDPGQWVSFGAKNRQVKFWYFSHRFLLKMPATVHSQLSVCSMIKHNIIKKDKFSNVSLLPSLFGCCLFYPKYSRIPYQNLNHLLTILAVVKLGSAFV